ncbi:putative trichothecene 3-O-acetyltransferase [Aspergillus ruber CBS 135680]|uniref:Putative trichothecene 3-O-acetyltransferase n=1 Tax=Aspergillus ruber (strain CBS 135680) TaxID=1388766 RepID=A0A017SL87_ASPRC|nr:putative trichothecene 3-O-acetyltransferase [Aspergillus ruber CBS 135680]EYE97743.1 putative trichothecene 3-O-acetyltransferase [Aspergillus ruber CBS 135680]
MQKPAGEVDVTLDVLGQQPFLKIYTQICLCFSMPDNDSDSTIIHTLTNGLERLTASFPWIAGQVVNEGASEDNTGIFKIKPLENIPRLVIKDLRNDLSIPTMDSLRQAKFPMSMLDEEIICPCRTLPLPGTLDEFPVFLVQANFITGGLLLSMVAEHGAMDMTGQGQIIRLLSKACRNESFTAEELSTGNLCRHDIIPLLDSYEPGPELSYQITRLPSTPPAPPAKSTWAYFSFQPSSLAALKYFTMQTVPTGYISTDDALTALIWQSVTRARLPRLNPETNSTFARAVDVRRFLDIHQTYPGLIQNMTYHTNVLQSLVYEPLGVIASRLRLAVNPNTSTLGYDSRALATFLARSPDKTIFSFSANLDLSTDMMLSSWARVECYDLDFGLGLGCSEAVRRPQFDPFESLVYLLPKTPEGEITAAICLRDEDMQRVRVDVEFMRYAKYIG